MTQGYAADAKDHSEKTHRLPPPPDAKGDDKYERVYAGILDVIGVRPGETFTRDDKQRPCVFTRKEDVEMVESILDQLSHREWRETFDVFTLELLFYELKREVGKTIGENPFPQTVTNDLIAQDRYDATPNISCDFHKKEDVERHCALSYVKRWVYLLADHICEKIGVELKHQLPANAALPPPPKPPKRPAEDDTRDDDFKNSGSAADVGASGSHDADDGGQNREKRSRNDDSEFSGLVSSKIHDKDESDSSEPDDYWNSSRSFSTK